MFQLANASKSRIRALLLEGNGCELTVTLAGQLTSILFTEAHWTDARACLTSVEMVEDDL